MRTGCEALVAGGLVMGLVVKGVGAMDGKRRDRREEFSPSITTNPSSNYTKVLSGNAHLQPPPIQND